MFIINKDSRFFVLNNKNEFIEFKNKEELLRWLYNQAITTERNWLFYFRNESSIQACKDFTKRIGHSFRDTYPTNDSWFTKRNPVDFIIYDAYFRVIGVKELEKELIDFCKNANLSKSKWKKNRNWQWKFKELEHHRFRREPVPGVHKSHWRFSTSYRHAECLNEKKAFYASLESGVKPRVKRSPAYLADAWDDGPRSDYFIKKSWKKTKKRKQWM